MIMYIYILSLDIILYIYTIPIYDICTHIATYICYMCNLPIYIWILLNINEHRYELLAIFCNDYRNNIFERLPSCVGFTVI